MRVGKMRGLNKGECCACSPRAAKDAFREQYKDACLGLRKFIIDNAVPERPRVEES